MLSQKAPIINRFRNPKNTKSIYLFLKIESFFLTKSVFFDVYLRSLLFSNLRLALFVVINLKASFIFKRRVFDFSQFVTLPSYFLSNIKRILKNKIVFC